MNSECAARTQSEPVMPHGNGVVERAEQGEGCRLT